MESALLAFLFAPLLVVCSSYSGIADWDDIVVVRENTPTTLGCTDTTVKGDISINWKVKSLGADDWKLVLYVDEKSTFSGNASKPSMGLTDSNFRDTGVFSLSFIPKVEDGGRYLCLIKQQERKLKERIVLLAILTVIAYPASPVPQHSTLRLFAKVTPDIAVTKITWTAPGGIPMKSKKMPSTGTAAKLPQVQNSDGGTYVCTVYPVGSRGSVLTANVDVTVDADKVASFADITHEQAISTAIQTQMSFNLTCPNIQGDYVQLYWLPPDSKSHTNMKLVYQYDRWRGSTLQTEQSKKLQPAGEPYNAEAGNFSFLLTPELKDGGLYICEVSLNDNVLSRATTLSMLKVQTRSLPSKLELLCLYSERSQVKNVEWKHNNKSSKLKMTSSRPGSISIIVQLNATGNYTCILQLRNGQVIRAVIRLPHKESVTVATPTPAPSPSQLPFLPALLLLVPLVPAAVGVLLWRQKHISDRGIEQSLSVHSGDAENIYENPEDVRQAPPQGSVYMDLKPRGEDDVYKELERYEQCQS